jgi:hypothetical protein
LSHLVKICADTGTMFFSHNVQSTQNIYSVAAAAAVLKSTKQSCE